MPYVLTNCHNSLCAVGGTINEDDHMFGLTCAKKYGGVYVPPHQAVIHQFAREMLAGGGKMILGSDSHTRYGALGTMAMGEGGPELVKQLLNKTYDIRMPGVIAIYLDGEPIKGVGPQDVALAIIGAVFKNGYVNNKVMEFVGTGREEVKRGLPYRRRCDDHRTTCLSSIWTTDEKIQEFYEIHGRSGDYKELNPGAVTYYDGCVYVNLSEIRPMIAMPFHPSNVYTIDELNANLEDILHDVEQKALVSLDGAVDYSLQDKIRDGKLYVEQGIIAGCAGGGFENICAAADIIKGRNIGSDAFTFSVYPASMPIYMELVKNGAVADLMEAGTVVKTAFCGPCFGAGDTPANNALSIRHTTRNFPNAREANSRADRSHLSLLWMHVLSLQLQRTRDSLLRQLRWMWSIRDRNITLTAISMRTEYLTATAWQIRVWRSSLVQHQGLAGDVAASGDLIIKVVSEIHDPVTTTDELIPSGETSSYRSNPLGLAEFALSRKDPAYVGRAKEVQKAQKAIEAGECPLDVLEELKPVMETIQKTYPEAGKGNIGVGSTIFAVKPGDGSAREQAGILSEGSWRLGKYCR